MVTHNLNAQLIDNIDSLLAPFGARVLSSSEISQPLYKNALYGWEIDTGVKYSNEYLLIHLVFFSEANQKLPNIYVDHPDFKKALKFPHVESNGKLCVWPERYIVDLDNACYIIELLSDAFELLNKAIERSIESHFEDEFQSYWLYHSVGSSKDVSLINNDNTTSRAIFVRRLDDSRLVFAENTKQLVSWLDNQSKIPRKNIKARERHISRTDISAVIFFNRAIHPDEYPKKASELYSLVENEFVSDKEKVLRLIANSLAVKSLYVPHILLSFLTKSGRALVGLSFERGLFQRKSGKACINGFREKVPLKVVLNRTSNLKTVGRLITRADTGWLFGRDMNTARKSIAQHCVAVIGCGSIGSSIARLLVKSGVERLIFIDGDRLNSENIGRHDLGFDYVSFNKAAALMNKLSKEYPHLSISHYECDFNGEQELCEALRKVDIIISCTGNWYSEQKLLEFQTKEFIPIVYAFVEAHAIAGHVIVNQPGDNAFNSLHCCAGNAIGQLKQPVTIWDSETLIKIPACAGEFQPYGAIEIGYVHSLAAKKVLSLMVGNVKYSSHSIWFGNSNDLENLGGQWNEFWLQNGCRIDSGSKIMEFSYRNDKWIFSDGHDEV